MRWPEDSSPSDPVVGEIFSWVKASDGTIVWRREEVGEEGIAADAKEAELYPAIVQDDEDIPILGGDWIVRMPAVPPASRFIVETAADFDTDYQKQARELRGGQRDFLAEIDKIAKGAEAQEAAMTPMERREANNVELERLGNVAKGLS